MILPKSVMKAVIGRTFIFTDLHELDNCQRSALKCKCGQRRSCFRDASHLIHGVIMVICHEFYVFC
jgi:hypothetical protein